MASQSLYEWRERRSHELDQLASAHQAVAGKGPGRRYPTRQINHAYVLAIAAQFQGFARDIHTEAVDALISAVTPLEMQLPLRTLMTSGRDLDSRNASPSALGSDFQRLGISLWAELRGRYTRAGDLNIRLGSLNDWRNAIAHDDFTRVAPETEVRLQAVRGYRSACDQLAAGMDKVVGDYVATIVGSRPW